jgi:hypothetical protein
MPAIRNLSEIAAQAEPAFLPQPLEHFHAKRKPESKSGQSAHGGEPGDDGRHRKSDARSDINTAGDSLAALEQ